MIDLVASISSVYTVATAVGLILCSSLVYCKICHSYWRSRKVAGPPPTLFIGNSIEMMSSPFFVFDKQLTSEYGDLVGIYDRMNPILIINDADIVQDATIKQFTRFMDRPDFNGDKIITNMLATSNGSRWKRTRKLMTPAFTSTKINCMSQLMFEPVSRLMESMRNRTEMDLQKSIHGLTLQVIVRSAFGVDLVDGSEYETALHHATKIADIPQWKIFVAVLCPLWIKKLINFNVFNGESFKYFYKLSENILTQRKLKPNEGRATDFVDLMLEAGENEKDLLTAHQIMANSVLILTAGFETTASLLLNCFFLLAHHQHVQDKLRESLAAIELHENVNFASHADQLNYLEAVIRETLRLYPPFIRIERVATETATLANGLTVDRGTVLTFAINCLHRNPKYWHEPDEFNPQRFMPENKDKLHPYAFMPFHLGPRNCIGERFALNEARMVIIQMIKNFKLLPSKETPFPLDYSASLIVLRPSAERVMVRLEAV